MSMYQDDDSHYDSDFAYDSAEENNLGSSSNSQCMSRVNTSLSLSTSNGSCNSSRSSSRNSSRERQSNDDANDDAPSDDSTLDDRLASIPSSWCDEEVPAPLPAAPVDGSQPYRHSGGAMCDSSGTKAGGLCNEPDALHPSDRIPDGVLCDYGATHVRGSGPRGGSEGDQSANAAPATGENSQPGPVKTKESKRRRKQQEPKAKPEEKQKTKRVLRKRRGDNSDAAAPIPKKRKPLFSSCIEDDDSNNDDDDDDDADYKPDAFRSTSTAVANVAAAAAAAADADGYGDPTYHRTLMKKLVTHKDVVTETFLRDVIDSLPHRSDLSAPELSRLWKDEAKKRITQYSVTLSHKLSPLVQIMLDQKLSASLESTFAEVPSVQHDMYDMVSRYERCFNKWVDDSRCVSFKATNTRLLGTVNVKDMFVLTFFTFCTCRRTKNDNILQLGVVGLSTSGKSTVFEACLMEGSHVTTNEQGVGRYQVGNKPVLLFHDIDIRTLVVSKDSEKIKTIARTEPTVTKIHSSTYTLQPLFIFYSSNERLMTHKFSDSLPNQPFQWRLYHGQVNEMCGQFGMGGGGSGGRKRATEENLAAIQNRFIECFVRKAPKLDQEDLPQSGGFSRMHGILGMYPRILDTLQRYTVADFYSPMLPQYVLHGLCSNFASFASTVLLDPSARALCMKKEEEAGPSSRYISSVGRGQDEVDRVRCLLRALVERYVPSPQQQNLLDQL